MIILMKIKKNLYGPFHGWGLTASRLEPLWGSTALQIRAGQQSITTNLQPLTAHIYHELIIVTGGFFKKFFINIVLFSWKFFWKILKLFFWNLNTLTQLQNTKNKSVFLLSAHFLLAVTKSFCVLTLSTFSYFSAPCKHAKCVCSPFDYCFAINLCNNALHPLYMDRFSKTNLSSLSFPWWSLNFLKTRLNSVEIRISKLSKVWYENK